MRFKDAAAIVLASVMAAERSGAQDSVALTPGGNDALSAYGPQQVRYIVDGVSLLSSWGNEFLIAPILKASRDPDPIFNTQTLASIAISPDVLTQAVLPPVSYALWTTRGEGVNPSENMAPPSVMGASFDRMFSIACSDFGASATNIIGATVGLKLTNSARLYVTRTVVATSRSAQMTLDTSSLSLGAIDASGFVHLRADDFGVSALSTSRISGDNILRIDLSLRAPGVINDLTSAGAINIASDASATTFVLNAGVISTNTPAAIPASKASAPNALAATLDFAGQFRVENTPSMVSHLAPGIVEHRGNPSYADMTTAPGGSGGAIASLGVSLAGAGAVDSLNFTGVNSAGDVVSSLRATLPAVISTGAFIATNPQFRHHQSQTSFRGGNGQVAIGRVASGDLLLAATASDGATGDFIAVATFPIGTMTPVWSIAAFPDAPVLNGPTGEQIGKLSSGALIASPIDISAPGIDRLGNIYFIAAYTPNLGAPGAALIKAVNTVNGYKLERLLETGEILTGANSTRNYQIVSLALGDFNSIASGSFFSGCVLQPRHQGATDNPLDPLAFGGAIVTAVIRYDNLSIPEQYDAVLFVGPRPPTTVIGDLDGDGKVGAVDLAILIGSWGANDPSADLSSDGVVGAADLAILIGSWG